MKKIGNTVIFQNNTKNTKNTKKHLKTFVKVLIKKSKKSFFYKKFSVILKRKLKLSNTNKQKGV